MGFVKFSAPYGDSSVLFATEKALNISVKNYASATVISIQGVPAVDYTKNFARVYNGGFKDLSASFNSLFARLTSFYGFAYGGISNQPLIRGFSKIQGPLYLKGTNN